MESTGADNKEVRETISKIIYGFASGEAVVFCGAGISRDSGLPVVNQLVPYILQKLDVSEEHVKLMLDKDNSPKIPFEAFMESIKENCDPTLIFNIFGMGEPNTNHFLLANLIKAGKLKTIVTTNFDKLIERALLVEPNPLIAGKDYDLIYKEQDFDRINWDSERIRIIKIHGSMDDMEAMAITLKQVANRELSQSRFAVIKNIFSKGNHKCVLILGYSSSDVFDLSPQIQAIAEKSKIIYYVQHHDISKVESINEQQEKNPFTNFHNSFRLYHKTGDLIKKIWDSTLTDQESYQFFTCTTNWKENVDEWSILAKQEYTEVYKYIIPATIFFRMGFFEQALVFYDQAIKIEQKNGNKQGEGRWLGNLALIFNGLGKYKKAIKYTKQALKIAKKSEDRVNEGSWLASLGIAYDYLGKYRKAITYFEQALEIKRELSDKVGEMTIIADLGLVYSNLGRYKKALENYEQTLQVAIDKGEKSLEGQILTNTGSVYIYLKEFRKAIEYYERALNVEKEIGNKNREGVCFANLAIAYTRLNNYIQAIHYYNSALRLLISLLGPDHPNIKTIEKNLKIAQSKVI